MRRLRALPIFIVLAVLHTWPLARAAGSSVTDDADGLLNVWLLETVGHRLMTHPIALFDVNAYYPFENALATLDHQLGAALFLAPFTLVTSNALLLTNLFTIVTFVLSGLFTAMLVEEITGSFGAGLIAGSIFAFSGTRIENINHTQVLGTCWLPLLLLASHRFIQHPGPRRAALLTAAALVFALTTWYYAVMAPLAIAIVALAGWRELRDRKRPVAVAAIVGCVTALAVLTPLAWPYVLVTREYLPHLRHASDVPAAQSDGDGGSSDPHIDRSSSAGIQQANSATIESYLGTGGSTRVPWTAPLRAVGLAGTRAFPGVVAAALALWGSLLMMRAQARVSRWAWVAVALTAIAVGAVIAVWAARGLAVLQITRAPGYFAILVVVWLSWLALRPLDPLMTMARTYVCLAVVGAVLSFGSDVYAFGTLVGHGIYPSSVPPFNFLRTSARFGALAVLGGAVLAGIAYARLSHAWSRRMSVLVAALLVVCVNAEAMAAPLVLLRVERVPAVYEWLRSAPPGPVVDFPIHGNVWALYRSLRHQHPLVNGAGLIEPAPFMRLKDPDDLSPAMIEQLRAYFQPRYVVINTGAYSSERRAVLEARVAAAGPALVARRTADDRTVFELAPASTGTLVLRSLRPSALDTARRLLVIARLSSAVAPRAAPLLEVWGNGQQLGAVPSPGDRARLIDVPLPADTRRGVDVEIFADYTLAGGTGQAIGRTGHAAPSDMSLAVDSTRTRIQVNGHVWMGSKGYTVLVLDASGRVSAIRAFNTSWSRTESHALADYIRSLEPGRAVAVASGYDASRELTADAVEALHSLGMAADLRGRFRWAHAAIGVTGAPPGTALESLGDTTATCTIGTPVSMSVTVEQMSVQ